MSQAAEARVNMLLNDILKAYEAKKMSGTHHVHVQHSLTDNLSRFVHLWSI